MAARAVWRGVIKIAEIVCPVSMYTAASQSERIALHMVNRTSGHRLKRVYVDDKTDKPVASEDQVKGYETSEGKHVVLEPEDIAAAVPDSEKALTVDRFIACNKIESTYFDKPYYLIPSTEFGNETFVLIREALRNQKAAAIAHAVLFRRLRPVLIRAHHRGLIATTLNFDYEVRSAAAAFKEIKHRKIEPEMLELAEHILTTKAGEFNPAKFEDRYEEALAKLVQAKISGKKIVPLRPPKLTKSDDLLEALRLSAGATDGLAKLRSSTPRKAAANTKAMTKKASSAKSAVPARRKAS